MKTHSQIRRVLEYIGLHGSISSKEAFHELGIKRLSARIYDIKKLGINTEKTMCTKYNRYGKVRYARYFLG